MIGHPVFHCCARPQWKRILFCIPDNIVRLYLRAAASASQRPNGVILSRLKLFCNCPSLPSVLCLVSAFPPSAALVPFAGLVVTLEEIRDEIYGQWEDDRGVLLRGNGVQRLKGKEVASQKLFPS